MPPLSTLRLGSPMLTFGPAPSGAAAAAPAVAPDSVAGTATAAASPPLDFKKSRREVPLGADESGSGVAAAPRLGMVAFRTGLSCRTGLMPRAAISSEVAHITPGAPGGAPVAS